MAYELMKGYLSKFSAAEAGQENKLGGRMHFCGPDEEANIA
jgi:hypothetical protein